MPNSTSDAIQVRTGWTEIYSTINATGVNSSWVAGTINVPFGYQILPQTNKVFDRGYRLIEKDGIRYISHKSIRYATLMEFSYGRKGHWYNLVDTFKHLKSVICHTRRMQRPTFDSTSVTLADMRFDVKGAHVFSTPGQFLKAVTRIKSRNLKQCKKPRNASKYIGVEIEFLAPHRRDTVENKAIQAKLEKFVEIKSDGSLDVGDEDNGSRSCSFCRDGCPETGDSECNCENGCDCSCDNDTMQGHELTMLGTHNSIFERVTKVTEFLSSIDAYVNKTCGLHVHIDMRHRDVEKCYANLLIMQPLLYSMTPVTRFQNNYCAPLPLDLSFYDGKCLERYKGINAVSYKDHKTLEIRLHAGTVNAKKISSWITLLLAIVDAPLLSLMPLGAMELQEMLGIDIALVKYIYSRLEKFEGKRLDSGTNYEYLKLAEEMTETPAELPFDQTNELSESD